MPLGFLLIIVEKCSDTLNIDELQDLKVLLVRAIDSRKSKLNLNTSQGKYLVENSELNKGDFK